MPFKPVEQIKCPKCSKSVYAAEARSVGELKFHKECYKCSMCNKMLDSVNVNCHETVLYCKTCHGRKFGPKGYGFGGGAAGLSMDSGDHLQLYGRDDKIIEYKAPRAAPGEGCPRCGGKVFAAEEMFAKGKVYHRTCFNCKTCRKPLDSMLHCDGPDKEVYCKACYGKKFGPKGYGYGHGAGTLTSQDPEVTPLLRNYGNADVIIKPVEGEQGCPRCGGKVFMAEEMLAKGRSFHKRCFKCRACKRPLDSMVHCDGPDGEIYCRLCYAKKYGPKGYGFAAGSGGVLTAENIPGGEDMPSMNPATAQRDVSLIKAAAGEGCPRCGGKVFMAEEMLAKGRSYHKGCYSCVHCKRPLDSVSGCDAPDGEIYCKLCYAKRFGPKGYGFCSGGGGVLTAENIGGGEDHQKQQQISFTTLDVSKIRAKEGEGCPRCGGKVFMAEEIHVRDRSYHKRCYNCCHCHRPLDSVVGCDSPDGEVYCKLCYAKKYGPKGYGFASGSGGVLTAENIPGGEANLDVNPASVAIDTTAILAAPGEGCPRCGGKVFNAEEMLSRANKWHKRCFNCLDCHRPLDSMVLCDGPDGEIYCKLCYAKKYGPKGYGFASGQGGVLFPESLQGEGESLQVIGNAPIYHTQKEIQRVPAKEGQARCPRCGGAVFQAESMVARNKEWHKQCYNCVECHRPLDSMIGCDAPDGEIYCKLCYAKRHGPKGYGYGHTATLLSLGTDDGSPIPSDIRQFGFALNRAKQFLEGSREELRSQEQLQQDQQEIQRTQKTIVSQIKNLPQPGRVPRTVEAHGEFDAINSENSEITVIHQSSSQQRIDEENVETSDFKYQMTPFPQSQSIPQIDPTKAIINDNDIVDLEASEKIINDKDIVDLEASENNENLQLIQDKETENENFSEEVQESTYDQVESSELETTIKEVEIKSHSHTAEGEEEEEGGEVSGTEDFAEETHEETN